MLQTTTNGINILKTWAKGTFNPIIWDALSSVVVEKTGGWKKWKLSNGKHKAEIQQLQRPVVNLVTPLAQAIEKAKSEIELKRKENGSDSMPMSAVCGQQQRKKYHNKPPVDWNSFRY